MKTVYLLGDFEDIHVRDLISTLAANGVSVERPTDGAEVELGIICFTGKQLPQNVYAVLDQCYGSARLLPCLFPGGTTSPLFADIKAADFSSDPDRAFQDLFKAIARLAR